MRRKHVRIPELGALGHEPCKPQATRVGKRACVTGTPLNHPIAFLLLAEKTASRATIATASASEWELHLVHGKIMLQQSNAEIQPLAVEPSNRERRASSACAARTLGEPRIARHLRSEPCLRVGHEFGSSATEPVLNTLIDPLCSDAPALGRERSDSLLRQLHERLACARSSTRLYEDVSTMLDIAPALHPFGVSRDIVARFRNEEAAHFELLCECLDSLGADPLPSMPSVRSQANRDDARQEIDRPGRRLARLLERLLCVQRADQAAWERLVAMARAYGNDELARRFGRAWFEETEHVRQLLVWLDWLARAERRVA